MAVETKEHISFKTDKKHVKLTNHRIRSTEKSWGTLKATSIMLSKITGAKYKLDHQPAYILLGFIGLAGSFFLNTPNAEIGGGVFFVLLIAIYFITRKQAIRISSASDSIELDISNKKALEFIDEIEDRITHL